MKPPGINKLQNYKVLEEELGKGAFSRVFAATHLQTNNKVAMKIVKLRGLNNALIKLCVNEVTLLNQVNSPHVLKIYDSFVTNDMLFLTTELIDGPDLAVRIAFMRERGKIFSERTIWYILHQIFAGINVLHEKRILHRDLKPANIFITSKCHVKIGDLGLSHHFCEGETTVKAYLGTEYYMSPERVNEKEYDFPADIWSLGCIIYEICTFRSPFNGETKNVFALHKKINNCDYLPFPMNVYSEQLEYFTFACLNKNPDERPTAKECYDAACAMHKKFDGLLRDYNKTVAASKDSESC